MKYVNIDLEYLNGKSKKPKILNLVKPFDRISLYKDPNIKNIITLEVRGEVNSPGTVTFEDLIESMSSVLDKSGAYWFCVIRIFIYIEKWWVNKF